MTIEDIQSICSKFKGVTTDIKWEDHLCFNIGEKMFLVTSPDKVPPSASFKTTDEDFEKLSEQDGFSPAPYLARYKWIYVDDISLLSKNQWEYFAEQAYQLIASKLPAKTKKVIGI